MDEGWVRLVVHTLPSVQGSEWPAEQLVGFWLGGASAVWYSDRLQGWFGVGMKHWYGTR